MTPNDLRFLHYCVGLLHILSHESLKPLYKLKIYDLKAIKNDKSTDDLLVNTLDLEGSSCYIEDDAYLTLNIMMNESEIFCFDGAETNRFNFGSLECFRNAAKSVTLSLPWRSVWRSKGVDEEPLEPAHHMEVYKEVLKYFEELSLNCRTAITTRSINDADLATFTLGDDFIGYRQNNPKMFIYDQNMHQTNQKMIYKNVQISQSTYVTIMGKTVLFLDNTTGQVINEERLERVPNGWHFNCCLLVCVHKIANHEHLLSVWRVGNSSKLTHMNEVAIEDYDGSLQVDEMFIAVKTTGRQNAGTKTYNFISMKTFQVERSVSSRAKYSAYDKGCLFLQNKNLIRILDVASGTFLRDIRVEPHQLNSIICCANSNYVVILSCHNYYSKLYVYDLKCLKETDAVPSHLLLTTIVLELQVNQMLMNETRIVCLNSYKMYVVDLNQIDHLRSPQTFDLDLSSRRSRYSSL